MAYSVAGVLVSDSAGMTQSLQASMAAVNGKLHIVWSEGAEGTYLVAKYRRWGGSSFDAAASTISSSSSYSSINPAIAVSTDGTLIAAHWQVAGVSGPFMPATGRVMVSESTDGGVTWSTSAQLTQATRLYGIGQSRDGVEIYVLTESYVYGRHTYKLFRRTSSGTWEYQDIYQLTFPEWWYFSSSPFQNMAVQTNGGICIVGGLYRGQYYAGTFRGSEEHGFGALVGSWGHEFTEHWITKTPNFDEGISMSAVSGMVCEGTDGVLRALCTDVDTDGTGSVVKIAYSRNYGHTWGVSQPAAFRGVDSFGSPLVLPPPADSGAIALALDGANNWWITQQHHDPDELITNRLHRWRGVGFDPGYFQLNSSQALPTSGGATANEALLQGRPGASGFLGKDYYRLISAWDSVAGKTELQLLKESSIGATSKTGGSNVPTLRSDT